MFLFTRRLAGPDALQLPRQYEFLQDLGEGGFGKVVKCWNKDTKQTVAVEIPKFSYYDSKEHNVVPFFSWFHMSCGPALVLEMLDISIQDYILKTHHAPMRLRDVSTIIQQEAILTSMTLRNTALAFCRLVIWCGYPSPRPCRPITWSAIPTP
ncbi:homeodomain-interacting protein kinase 1-like [Sander lucioperca]|uniref:homeodomain-interacting protein kinase 1-like n=1 Tax=Sander lucioperca TaxID=283035 RepID=UPI00125D2575|nr:homeodomain-interacting protein kinase 1-like [Sander lucioperca]